MRTCKSVVWLAPILLYSASAAAQLSFHDPLTNQGVLDQVISEFSTRAAAWQTVVMRAASWLFWTLGTISFTWTMGMLALKKADIGEFFTEFIRFTLFFGFFYWLLQNGQNFADSIIRSMRQIGDEATGTTGLSPSGIVNVGFMIWKQAIKNLSVWSPIDSFVGVVLSAGILLLMAVIAVNMLLLLVSAWILMYAGIFFLGFGGARWTSDMAINYFKTVLGVAVQLFAMILLVGIGNDLLTSFYAKMAKETLNFEELGVMLVFCVSLLILVSKIPPLLASIITGGGIGGAGGIGNFSAGALVGATMGAAAMGAATAATAGAALTAGGANMAGGAQALMAAFSKANAAASAGGNSGDLMAAADGGSSPGGSGSGGGSGRSSALAAAMGDDSSGNYFGANQPGSASSSQTRVGDADAKKNGDTKDAKAADDNTQSNGPGTRPDAKANYPQDDGAPGQMRSHNPLATTSAAAAKVGKIAVGTAANLVQGSWDVTKAKGHELMDVVMDRVGETVGGKIATAIKASDAARNPGADNPAPFDKDSLSKGTMESPDASAEVAAFRDRDPKGA
jgi:type IV secretion system protein TrbL